MHRLIWPFAVCICLKTCFCMVQPKYRIQPNNRTVCLGFQKCWENLWWNMYLPILKVHLKKKKKKLWRTYQIMLMRCFCMLFLSDFYYKAYVVGTHLNCIDKSMQFKWVPTIYAFIKKQTKITVAVIWRLRNCLTVLIGAWAVIRSNTALYFISDMQDRFTSMSYGVTDGAELNKAELRKYLKFRCSTCGKICSSNKALVMHTNIHTGAQPYVCDQENCGAKFNHASNLLRHVKNVHMKLFHKEWNLQE